MKTIKRKFFQCVCGGWSNKEKTCRRGYCTSSRDCSTLADGGRRLHYFAGGTFHLSSSANRPGTEPIHRTLLVKAPAGPTIPLYRIQPRTLRHHSIPARHPPHPTSSRTN